MADEIQVSDRGPIGVPAFNGATPQEEDDLRVSVKNERSPRKNRDISATIWPPWHVLISGVFLKVVIFPILKVWAGSESNTRHKDFQSFALPTELPAHRDSGSHPRAIRPANDHSYPPAQYLAIERRNFADFTYIACLKMRDSVEAAHLRASI
jgi:hypothetical protein